MSTIQPDDSDSLETKYKGLKRKYEKLFNHAFNLSEELHEEKLKVTRLKKEKNFLLDRFIKMEKLEKDQIKAQSKKTKKMATPIPVEKPPQGNVTKIVLGSPSATTSSKSMKPKGDKDANAVMCAASIGPNRPCKSRALAGSMYCWRHGPLDPNSEFMFCTFSSESGSNKKKCSNPILKTKEIPFCTYHTPKAIMGGYKVDDPVKPTEGEAT